MARRGSAAEIDLIQLEKLCMLQCTDEEIACWFGVTTRTIERRRKLRAFQEAMDRGKARGRISMRRAQLRMLEAGNATMGVWLGKQYLNQRDERDLEDPAPKPIVLVIPTSIGPDDQHSEELARANGPPRVIGVPSGRLLGPES